MRVLIATQNLEVIGGVETYLKALIPRLVLKGFDVALLACSDCEDKSKSIIADYAEIPVWICSKKTVPEVINIIELWCPDLVYYQGIEDSDLETAIVVRFSTVFYAHNYHGTCVSGTKTNGVIGKPCHRRLGASCLVAYYPFRCGGLNPITMIKLFQKNVKRKNNFDRFKFVLVASRHMADEFHRHGVERKRIGLVPLFPTGTVPDEEPPKFKAIGNRVLWVGRITWLKGLNHLIEAMRLSMAKLKRSLTLVVAGDGPDRQDVEAMAAKAKIPVEFLGWVNADKRNTEMRKADILAVPSIWPEPFGLVGLEAACVGLPAVAYGTGGIPDWLVAGFSGEMAPGEHPRPAHLADAICRALDDEGHLQKLRTGAWEMSKKFILDVHLDRLSDVFFEVTKSASTLKA